MMTIFDPIPSCWSSWQTLQEITKVVTMTQRENIETATKTEHY